jgi:hypothetical protein
MEHKKEALARPSLRSAKARNVRLQSRRAFVVLGCFVARAMTGCLFNLLTAGDFSLLFENTPAIAPVLKTMLIV